MVTDTDMQQAQTWVIKIGSSLLTDQGRGLNHQAIQQWVAQCAQLQQQGKDVVIVSSGAVAEGMNRLGWKSRPHALNKLQAAAAVGQMGLVQAYATCFQKFDIHTAQILITHEDLANRQRYLNSRNTLRELLDMHTVPIINENDTVATDEIRLGDNDTLAGFVANLIDADVLLILTDQQGLYDRDPRLHKDATLIKEITVTDESLYGFAGETKGEYGRGGMRTKIAAARIAARSRTITCIADGREENIITAIAAGERVGSRIVPDNMAMTAKKQWLAGQLHTRGHVVLDDGAVSVLSQSGGSLLAVGVEAVSGDFLRGDIISCVNKQGAEIARGLINYSAADTKKIVGLASDKFEAALGYVSEEELIHRDNLVLTDQAY